ncbi:hypothetical protein FA13DRAFT_1705324 [Coprinellus micaceus]|uniref:DNA repair protein Rad26 n=1 Tax=Coprinellus micaceus TaxID=71717 RepID=A0A4Y7TW61_COPMI|nr:hypothetical protein FA13DRAFT_1705324 [Coprinellus micaceus]
MADFDDYFDDDDFVLDEAAEAALAATERQYATQTQQQVVDRPVLKRQRISTSGWTPGLGTRCSDSYDDFGLYPEITVQGNGYQALALNEPVLAAVPPRVPAHNPPRPNPPQRQPQQNVPVPQLPQRPITPNYRPQSVSRVPSASQAPSRRPSPAPGPHPLEAQLQQVLQQVEEQKRTMLEIQAKYQEALETKTRKEGEVSILRKTIEKHTQEHSAELVRLRSARQESEAKQMQMQKTLKEDMERLKTQLLFKQQELEAALRRPPGSVRAKKPREAPATPLPNKGWTPLSQRPNFNVDVQQTPSRMSLKPPPKVMSPKKKSPSKPKMLPGFQNSFTTSTPIGLKSKGKERERPPVDDGNVFNAPLFSQPLSRPFPTIPKPTQNELQPPEPSFRPSSPPPIEHIFESQTQPLDQDGDVVMGAETQQEDLEEEYDTIDPPNWKAEVRICRLMLTHVRVGSSKISFQHLLSVDFAGDEEVEDSTIYTTAYIGLLNAISHPVNIGGYDLCLTSVASAFITMADILAKHKLRPQLSSLFDLLSTLTFFLPRFRSSILGEDEPGTPASSPLVRPICMVITTCLDPKQADESDLSKSILSFLEAIAFDLSDEDALKLSELIRNRAVVDVLLHSTQSHAFLEQVSRILVLLAIRKPLCWALLSLPDPTRAESDGPPQRNGLTERLCAYLVDPTREIPAFYAFKENIVTYFAQLSLAAPEAFTHLGNHPLLLASILWHTSLLTTPLYEDDERLMQSTSDSSQYGPRVPLQFGSRVDSSAASYNISAKLYTSSTISWSGTHRLEAFVTNFSRRPRDPLTTYIMFLS